VNRALRRPMSAMAISIVTVIRPTAEMSNAWDVFRFW
jgi:hypothetical protein